MALTLELEPLVVVYELDSGAVYAHPVADPALVCRDDDAAGALDQQREFLSKYLSRISADEIADFMVPPQTDLVEVAVTVPRADLPRRFPIRQPLSVACVVIPDGAAQWVHVLALGHTVHVRPGEDLVRRVQGEVERAAAARHIDGDRYLSLLPAIRTQLIRVDVRVERSGRADLGARASERRERDSTRARDEAQKLLGSIGTSLLSQRTAWAPVIGREREVRTLASLLSGSERLSVALVGPEMTGKSAIVRGLVSQKTVPFRSRPVYATSGAQLVAGQSGFGQLQQRVDEIMRAAERLDAILYFDNFGDLFAGHSGSIEDIASAMRPWVAEGRVRVLGELTPEQAEHHEKHHVGFFSALHRIAVEPLGPDTAREVVRAHVEHARRRAPSRPNLVDAAIDPLIELADRYLAYQAFPGKAVRMFDELRAVHESDVEDDGTPYRIDAQDVYRAFSIRSGIPLFLLREEQAMKFEEVRHFFERRVIGQHEAISRVAETLCMVKAGLQPPGKPLANFLFVGPTGVGKTEVAKTLARFLFGGPNRMVRFDMSEYMDPLAAERLIRGTDRDEGELTRRVRQQPFCVVLLDEIEKAHPAVFDLLLQVCGEGRLTDARGRTTWFHNAIIIMTSNLGAAHRRGSSGFERTSADEDEGDERYYVERVERHFRPEFVNRLDRIIPFRALGRSEIAEVARVASSRLIERDGISTRNLELDISDRALDRLASAGYSDRYGARALRRHLEDALVGPIAMVLSAQGKLAEGARLRVTWHDESDDGEQAAAGKPWVDERIGSLCIRMWRRPPRQTREHIGDLQAIARYRRAAAACTKLDPIGPMKERLDYLVADIATASRRKNGAVNIGRQVAEHARLSALLDAVNQPYETILGAEDLAIAAIEEGESAGPMCEEARAAFLEFERGFVRAALGAEGDAGIVLLVRRLNAPSAVARWLSSFLEGAGQRGWSVTLHLHDDPDRAAEPSWPVDLAWGPPRSAEMVSSRLHDWEPKALAKAMAAVLVRVDGDLAGPLLRLETGIVRYPPTADEPKATHVDVRWAWARSAVDSNDLRADAFALPDPVPPDKVTKLSCNRVFDEDGSIFLPKVPLRLSPESGVDYWRDLERIHFTSIVAALARGDDPLEREDG